jgi:hypothetical protein
MNRARAAPLAVLLFLQAYDASAADLVRAPREFLRKDAGFTELELLALDSGRIVAKLLETADRSEVVSLAAFRARAHCERVRRLLADVEGRRSDFEVLEIGRLPAVPTAADLQGLTLDPGDLESLKKCKVGNCNERIPADAIERFRREVDWSAADRGTRANTLWRQLLAGYAQAYISRGNAGLVEYGDNRDPGRIAVDLGTLLVRSVFLKESAPALEQYLSAYPQDRPANTDDIFYWMKEKFWLKNVQSLNHLTIVPMASPAGNAVFAATKQLFANHFFSACLSFMVFVESDDPGGSYLIYLNRTRADVRPTGFNWLERALVKRLVRGRLISQFRALKVKIDPGGPLPPDDEGP